MSASRCVGGVACGAGERRQVLAVGVPAGGSAAGRAVGSTGAHSAALGRTSKGRWPPARCARRRDGPQVGDDRVGVRVAQGRELVIGHVREQELARTRGIMPLVNASLNCWSVRPVDPIGSLVRFALLRQPVAPLFTKQSVPGQQGAALWGVTADAPEDTADQVLAARGHRVDRAATTTSSTRAADAGTAAGPAGSSTRASDRATGAARRGPARVFGFDIVTNFRALRDKEGKVIGALCASLLITSDVDALNRSRDREAARNGLFLHARCAPGRDLRQCARQCQRISVRSTRQQGTYQLFW